MASRSGLFPEIFDLLSPHFAHWLLGFERRRIRNGQVVSLSPAKGGLAQDAASPASQPPLVSSSSSPHPAPVPPVPQPLHVVCPEQYTQPPPAQSRRMDLMIDCQPPAMSYRRAEVLALPFKRRYEKIEIMPEVSCAASQGHDRVFHLSLQWLSLGYHMWMNQSTSTLKPVTGKRGGIFRTSAFFQ